MFTGTGVVAELLGAFNQNLIGIGSKYCDRFVDERFKRHRLFGLAAIHKVRAYPGRCDLEYANCRVLQQEALREDVRMKRRLGRRIHGSHGQRHESQHRAGIGDHRILSGLEVLDKRGRQADRPHEIGRDGGHHQRVIDLATRLVRQHDTGVIDQHVEVRIVRDQLRGYPLDAGGVGNVKLDCGHAWVRLHHLVQVAAPAAADDDLVAALVERLG